MGGCASGGAVGAAIGLVPAVFTFGLSIPFFTVVGAGMGLVSGAATGGSLGFVGGGAAGYGVYTKKDDIRRFTANSVQQVRSGAISSAALVREGAVGARAKAAESVTAVRTKLRAATGGSF